MSEKQDCDDDAGRSEVMMWWLGKTRAAGGGADGEAGHPSLVGPA